MNTRLYTEFDAKLVAYGRAKKEYDRLFEEWKAKHYPAGALEKKVDAADIAMGKAGNLLNSVLKKLAVAVA